MLDLIIKHKISVEWWPKVVYVRIPGGIDIGERLDKHASPDMALAAAIERLGVL